MATNQERRLRRQQIAQAVAAGGGIPAVALRFGVSVATVRQACHQYQVRSKALSASTYRILADLINTDLSLHEIAAKFGVSHQWVSQICKQAAEAGIPFKKHRRKTPTK